MMYGIAALLIYLFFLFVIGGGVYMIPSIIAIARRHNITKVILFNIFLGWTVVMWIFCMIWACSSKDSSD